MRILLCTLAFALAALTPVQAQEALEIGAAVPMADRQMPAAEGDATSLDAVMGERGLAVVFWSNTCPWVERYEDRIVALARDYIPAGVAFVIVNSNDPAAFPEESVAAIQQRAAERGYPFSYVVDEGSTLARAFGATRTPQIFLFDTGRSLVYEGTVDDSPSDAAEVEEEYFRDALASLVAGEPVEVQKTKAFGCTIKFPD